MRRQHSPLREEEEIVACISALTRRVGMEEAIPPPDATRIFEVPNEARGEVEAILERAAALYRR